MYTGSILWKEVPQKKVWSTVFLVTYSFSATVLILVKTGVQVLIYIFWCNWNTVSDGAKTTVHAALSFFWN